LIDFSIIDFSRFKQKKLCFQLEDFHLTIGRSAMVPASIYKTLFEYSVGISIPLRGSGYGKQTAHDQAQQQKLMGTSFHPLAGKWLCKAHICGIREPAPYVSIPSRGSGYVKSSFTEPYREGVSGDKSTHLFFSVNNHQKILNKLDRQNPKPLPSKASTQVNEIIGVSAIRRGVLIEVRDSPLQTGNIAVMRQRTLNCQGRLVSKILLCVCYLFQAFSHYYCQE
jgi:hypothetical protein